MADNNDERRKRIHENFERILPKLWDKARANEVELKSEYLSQLQSKLLKAIRSRIPKDELGWWLDGKIRIEDINEDNQIIISSDSVLNTAWLQLRYDLLKKTIKFITNADFELSFVTRQEISPNPLEGKSYEELFEIAFGKKELERQKMLHEKRMLKPDYAKGELNISECVMCGCVEVPNVDIDIELKSKNKRFKSIKTRGGKCGNCSEEYYDMKDMDAIEKIEKLLDELFPETHSQNEG
ncbi:hypothetical protein ACFQI7_12990 [Paenibacillus allorhizosphaerae]|uniref:DUF721 domain-containing protein n=1 Tax=Paenibacillus allorhizosphaerae TaxID=2849866 RepID=A0ABN7TN41_9BACL|nr:hypothetical protein [Paenibacillus allorhizosphaerae]CAG7648163.1 hypothetical protein PAECIP111802_04141 [Paenibacillus allorhizosphaerae]